MVPSQSRITRLHVTLITVAGCAFVVGYFSGTYSAVAYPHLITRAFRENPEEPLGGPESRITDPKLTQRAEQLTAHSQAGIQPQLTSVSAPVPDGPIEVPRSLPLAANGCPADADTAGALLQRGMLLGPIPWKCIPANLRARFTLGGRVRMEEIFRNGDHNGGQQRRTWTVAEVRNRAGRRRCAALPA